MTWSIFLGISALFAFGVAVVTPIVKLNTTITKLNCTVEMLNTSMQKLEKQVDSNTAEINKLKGVKK